MEAKEKIENFFNKLDYSFNVLNYLDADDINKNRSFDYIREVLVKDGIFRREAEMIYYNNSSGYCSEILSILSNEKELINKFDWMESEITKFFESLEEDKNNKNEEKN